MYIMVCEYTQLRVIRFIYTAFLVFRIYWLKTKKGNRNSNTNSKLVACTGPNDHFREKGKHKRSRQNTIMIFTSFFFLLLLYLYLEP